MFRSLYFGNALLYFFTVILIARVDAQDNNHCYSSGSILREYWANTKGNSLDGVPMTTTPTNTSFLDIFEAPLNVGENYGSRIRGYICVPTTGAYTFWIASNDNSELYLSTNDNLNNKKKIAYVNGMTSPRQWDKYPSQKSIDIELIEGHKYYIEAIHIQNGGTDNLSIGWQLPNGIQERPIPGIRLSPYVDPSNKLPEVSITSPLHTSSHHDPASIVIHANATDSDGKITKVEFFRGTTKLGEDISSPYSFHWTDVPAGNYTLIARAHDNSGASINSAIVNLIIEPARCTASGTILRELWEGVNKKSVLFIPLELPPTSISQLDIFEGPSNAGIHYGARYRGYICAPVTGHYIFWIASNDESELWISKNEDPNKKKKIAYVNGSTSKRQWDKYPSQKSIEIKLVEGHRYYIEALHKQDGSSDNLAVGWQLPNGAQEMPIPGNRLSPFVDTTKLAIINHIKLKMNTNVATQDYSINIDLYPNLIQKGILTLSLEGYEQSKQKANIVITQKNVGPIYSEMIPCENCKRTIINIDENLKPGIYLVEVTIDDKVYSENLVIE